MTEPETLLQHATFLRGLARGLLGGSEDAGDVVQQTWLAALEKGPRRPEKARAWLAATLRNFVRMSYRGKARRSRREEAAARPERVVATDEIAELTELQRRVAEAVHTLEEPYRTTIVLRYLEERTTADIARKQGVPAKTVQTRLRRGLKLLRGRLDSAYGGNRKTWALLLVPLALPSTASAAGGGAVFAAFWIMLMKPKILLPLLLLLALASTQLVRGLSPRDDGEVPRQARSPERVVANGVTPTEDSLQDPPAAQTGSPLLRGILKNRERASVGGALVTPGSWGEDESWHSTGESVRSDSDGAFAAAVERGASTGVFIVHPDYVSQRAWIDPALAEPRVVTLRRGVRIALKVLSPQSEPVAGARLDISHRKPEPGGMVGIEAIAQATTDETGRVAAVRVPKGRVAVRVKHAEFAEGIAYFDVDADSEQTIVLKLGGTITGRVLDRRGKAVAGARVRLDDNDENEAAAGVVTDASGRFTLDGLPPGWVDLVASAKGYGDARFGSALGWHESTPVPVRDRETTRGIEIILRDPTWLSGRVIDEKGRPLADVPIEVYIDGEVTAITDAKGRFRMALGINGVGSAALAIRSDDRWQIDGNSSIQLTEGQAHDLGDLRAVTTATLSGRVVDEHGKPVAKGRVATSSNVVSIRAGRFTMLVRPGTQQIRVQAQSETGPLVGTARLEVAPGETVKNITLTVKRAVLIRGRLISPDGVPSVPRWVMAVRVGEPMPVSRKRPAAVFASEDGVFTLVVSGDGEYRVGLREEDGRRDMVRFAADPPPATVKPGGLPITIVVPRLDATVTGQVFSGVTRRPLEAYEARLVEYRGGLPWNYSIITVRQEDGRFRFRDATGGAKYALEVAAAEHGLYRSGVFQPARGESHALPPITLAAQGRVRGRVVDSAGRAVPFARIAILGPNLETNVDRPVTDSEGRFAPIGSAPGERKLIAFVPSRAIGIADVRIGPGRTTEVKITLPSSAPLVVVVKDAQDRPRADVAVTFSADSIAPLSSEHMFRLYLHGHPGQSYRTDLRGELRIGFLPAGEVQLAVGDERRDATLVAGTETRVEFQIE
ncbi:MAG: sigma-70 family RNA polymerase sigma factor [Planctomycetota bacterium]